MENQPIKTKKTAGPRPIRIKFKKLTPDAVIPSYAHDGDVCMDVTVTSVTYDEEHDCYIYGTGLACETDRPISMFCHPRSSIYKTPYFLSNSVGVVDCRTYRGEIKVIFKHRETLVTTLIRRALIEYAQLPFWKRWRKNTLMQLILKERDKFLNNPLEYAPYKVGEKAFQIWLSDIQPVKIKEVTELSTTERGVGGFGSTGK